MTKRRRVLRITLLALLPAYVLSSGPGLATAFRLREATGHDGFYAAVWVYYPILMLPRPVWDPYIEWWVKLFGTVGPG
jgi:hypothetical protein